MAKFNSRSRYRRSQMVIADGVETVGTWSQPSYLKERPDSSFISTFYVTNAHEGRPDLIADRIYGSPDLDWVLIAFNAPNEILNWPTAGTTIEYPSRDLVFAKL